MARCKRPWFALPCISDQEQTTGDSPSPEIFFEMSSDDNDIGDDDDDDDDIADDDDDDDDIGYGDDDGAI